MLSLGDGHIDSAFATWARIGLAPSAAPCHTGAASSGRSAAMVRADCCDPRQAATRDKLRPATMRQHRLPLWPNTDRGEQLFTMQVHHGFNDVPNELRGGALAIGNFDGVHRGHQSLLIETAKRAKELGTAAGAMVFEPHPRVYFRPDEPMFALTSLTEKLRLFEQLHLDFAVVLKFDAALANLTPQAFARDVLAGGFNVRHVVVGYDFYFGKDRAGTPQMMGQLGQQLDFGVTVIPPIAEAGEVFSSSAVRARLSTGDVRGAAIELGHWWRVRGVVTGGAKRGTGLGFPTANITLPPGTALGHGIFATLVGVDGVWHEGAAYFGQRPTFDHGAPVLEVFLFDFDENLYGREIVVDFIGFVRPDQRFTDLEALKEQMRKDCEQAREMLAAARREQLFASYPLGAA